MVYTVKARCVYVELSGSVIEHLSTVLREISYVEIANRTKNTGDRGFNKSCLKSVCADAVAKK